MENYGFEEVEIISTVSDEHNYEVIIQENEIKLNDEQRIVYNTILESINNEDGTLFFLDAPAGTGKTFLINLLLAKMKMANKEHIAVASSGIAATLLLNGRTAHSIFKIPIQLNEDSICSINKNSKSGKLFKSCTFIVWDECTMTHEHALEAVDRMLRDIVNKDKPMGGLTLLLSGDFRQILTVVKRGTKTDHINSCLKTSVMWKNIRSMKLTKNMRVFLSINQDTATFENHLLDIGNGMTQKNNGMDIIPCGNIMENKNELIKKIYENVEDNYLDENWLCERCILTPKNDNVYIINQNLQINFQER